MKHEESGLRILNPNDFQKALDSKIDRNKISSKYSTNTLNIYDIDNSETTFKGEWLVASTKALLSFYIDTQEKKLDYNYICSNYKTPTEKIYNKYLQTSELKDNQLVLSIYGAKNLYNDLKKLSDNRYNESKKADQILDEKKVNFSNAQYKYNYYINGKWLPPTDNNINRDYFTHAGAFNLYKELYEDKVKYCTISDVFSDNGDNPYKITHNTFTDDKNGKKLVKIASELAVRRLFIYITNSLSNAVKDLNNKINQIWNKEEIVDYTNYHMHPNSIVSIFPGSELKPYSSYHIMCFYDIEDEINNMQSWRLWIGKKVNAENMKIFSLDEFLYKNNGNFVELLYRDNTNLTIRTLFDKKAKKMFKIKIKKEMENGNFKF